MTTPSERMGQESRPHSWNAKIDLLLLGYLWEIYNHLIRLDALQNNFRLYPSHPHVNSVGSIKVQDYLNICTPPFTKECFRPTFGWRPTTLCSASLPLFTPHLFSWPLNTVSPILPIPSPPYFLYLHLSFLISILAPLHPSIPSPFPSTTNLWEPTL